MEENDKQEEVDTSVEEQETTEVEETESDSDTPTLEDYEALQKKLKTIEAQKDHWRKKAEGNKPLEKVTEIKKDNNEYLTRDEALLLTKGFDEEEIDRITMISKSLGKGVNEVVNDEMFIAWKEKRDEKKTALKAQLGSSKGGVNTPSKPISKMTREEHIAYWKSLQK